jgi:hypothetical protein
MTPQAAARLLEKWEQSTRHQKPPREWTLTLAARDGKLLVRKQGEAAADAVLIYDKTRTFLCEWRSGDRRVVSVPGLWLSGVDPCPLPAVGLPALPLLQNAQMTRFDIHGVETFAGRIPRLNTSLSVPGQPISTEGRITAKAFDARRPRATADVVVLRAETGDAGHPTGRWEFLEHQQLGGVWIASRLSWSALEHGRPTRACEFQLETATTTPPPARQFVPRTWLASRARRMGRSTLVASDG